MGINQTRPAARAVDKMLFAVFTWISVCYVLFLCVQLLRILLGDCDLVLSLYDRWGRRPGAALGKVVWITGASSGIGEAIAYELAKAGSKLILSARSKGDLERVAEKCRGMLKKSVPCRLISLTLELSPESSRDAHMVLVLDLLRTETHGPLTAEAVAHNGHVRPRTHTPQIYTTLYHHCRSMCWSTMLVRPRELWLSTQS